MVEPEDRLARQLGAAAEQGEAPWGELEGQMEMLVNGIDSEAEHRDIEKSGIRYGYSRLPVKRTDIEFDLVCATKHAITIGDSVGEMSIRRAFSFGNQSGLWVQPTQPHRKSGRRHAARDVNGMDGNTARFVLSSHTHHPVVVSNLAYTEYHRKPATHSVTVQMAALSGQAGRG